MASRKLTFEGATGEELVGRLDLPADGKARAFALFAHCFTCSKDLKAATNLSRALNAQRIGVFRFDFTGLGESEGDFADTDFSSNVGDLVAAAGFMEREMEAPQILVGHSLGGAAVIRAASEIPASRAVATIGAPADPEHVKRNFGAKVEEIRERGRAEVTLAGREFTIKKQFLDDLEETRMEQTVRDLDRALLLFHSPVDNVVGIENAARLYGWAKHPKSFVSLDDADHLLVDEADSRYAGTVLGAWADKYVEADLHTTVAEEEGEAAEIA
ncbi:MAG: alpha/beta hydrolase family protein, partial [Gemmatimonadota bacterium]